MFLTVGLVGCAVTGGLVDCAVTVGLVGCAVDDELAGWASAGVAKMEMIENVRMDNTIFFILNEGWLF